MDGWHRSRVCNVLIEGKRHTVKLLMANGESRFIVKVDNKVYEVELLDELNYDTSVPIRVGDRLYKVKVEEIKKSKPFSVKVNDRLFRVEYEAVSRLLPKRTRYAE